jgi:hypothetical protein
MPLITSNNLDLVALVTGQTNPEGTANDKGGELDSFLTESLAVSVSSGNATVTAANYRRYRKFRITGNTTGGRTLTLQAIKRPVLIDNSDAANTQSIAIVLGSTTLNLAAGKKAFYETDGTANGLELIVSNDIAASGGAALTANNLSDLANAATARDNLGVEIGADVQAYDAQLSSLVRQNSQSAAYTTVLADGGKHILHPAADNNARTFTIDSNANVAYPIGTAITFVNEINTVTIAITSDTLTLAGTGTTGSRTLAANGLATALKVGTTKWVISGTGLT